jgi:urea transport system permease protein
MGILPSVEIAVWVAVGGRGTLFGPAAGALLVNMAKMFLSEGFPNYWLYFLGALFIGSVVFFPDGIVGIWKKIKRGEVGCPPVADSLGVLPRQNSNPKCPRSGADE